MGPILQARWASARGALARRCTEGVDVSESASISGGIAGRYATAAFALAVEAGGVAALEADVEALESALADSADLRDLISSPIYSRAEQGKAITALAHAMSLTETVGNLLGLMAAKRRLFVLPQLLAALHARISADKGEVLAEVTSAKALTKAQSEKLAQVLAASSGSDVKIQARVDEGLIGGLIVKMGSKMIDTSIASKLASLHNSMKEAR